MTSTKSISKNQLNIKAVSQFQRQLTTYFKRIAWILRDGWSHFRFRILLVVALNVLSITATGFVFGGIIVYVRHLDAGQPLSLFSYEIELDKPVVLITYVSTMLVVGLLSAFCLYQTEWIGARLAIQYQKQCNYQLFHIISDPAYRGWQRLVTLMPYYAIQELVSATRVTSVVLRRLMSASLPLSTFFFATACLIYTSPSVTALLIPLVLIYLIPLYQTNRWASKQQQDYTKVSRKSRKSVTAAVKFSLNTNASLDHKIDQAKQSLESPDYTESFLLFYARRLVANRVQLVNTSFYLICISGLFVFFGIATATHNRTWSDFLIYLLALQFAFSGLRQVTTLFVKLSRLQPTYAQYVDFIERARNLRQQHLTASSDLSPLPNRLLLKMADDPLWNGQIKFECQRGQIVWLIVPYAPDYGDLEAILVRLENAVRPRQEMLWQSICVPVVDEQALPSYIMAWRELFDQGASQATRLKEDLIRLNVWDELAPWIDRWQTQVEERSPLNFSEEALFVLSAYQAFSACEALLISAAAFLKLNATFIESFIKIQSKRYIFFVTEDPEKFLKRAAFRSIRQASVGAGVLGSTSLVSSGTLLWLESNLEEIQRYLEEELVKMKPADLDDDDDDDLFDDF
jgi:hypothetical protein